MHTCSHADRISLTGHGSLIAGESYTLQCSAGESQKIKLFEWLWESPDIDGRTPVANSSFLTITSNSSSESSQLEFRPLKQANNGSYFCRATAGEATLISQPIEVRAKGTLL